MNIPSSDASVQEWREWVGGKMSPFDLMYKLQFQNRITIEKANETLIVRVLESVIMFDCYVDGYHISAVLCGNDYFVLDVEKSGKYITRVENDNARIFNAINHQLNFVSAVIDGERYYVGKRRIGDSFYDYAYIVTTRENGRVVSLDGFWDEAEMLEYIADKAPLSEWLEFEYEEIEENEYQD